ncbi:MAG TPA: exodeoxyribonuclease VII small subunit [Elusimicrobiota bacterium]|jgi:exodeoxyribonuclease VII small subunit|nr:exodeoxyribonuclease VII small subunit [Elusimicrobiota bacterium]
MNGKSAKETKEPFEKSLERLEDVVHQLEAGEKGLEESLTLFESGVALSRQLSTRLEEVKHRVEVLTKDAQGKLKAAPLEDDAA